MIRVVYRGHPDFLEDSEFPDFPADVIELRNVLKRHGYIATTSDIVAAWTEHSVDWGAGWNCLHGEELDLQFLLEYLTEQETPVVIAGQPKVSITNVLRLLDRRGDLHDAHVTVAATLDNKRRVTDPVVTYVSELWNDISLAELAEAAMGGSTAENNKEAILGLDKESSKPHLLPGDIIETKAGNIGVIEESKVTVNGGVVEWNRKLPEVVRDGLPPAYAVRFFRSCGEHYAWWYASDFKCVVELGPAHKYRVDN